MNDFIMIGFSKHEFKQLMFDAFNDFEKAKKQQILISIEKASKIFQIPTESILFFIEKKEITFLNRGNKQLVNRVEVANYLSGQYTVNEMIAHLKNGTFKTFKHDHY